MAAMDDPLPPYSIWFLPDVHLKAETNLPELFDKKSFLKRVLPSIDRDSTNLEHSQAARYTRDRLLRWGSSVDLNSESRTLDLTSSESRALLKKVTPWGYGYLQGETGEVSGHLAGLGPHGALMHLSRYRYLAGRHADISQGARDLFERSKEIFYLFQEKIYWQKYSEIADELYPIPLTDISYFHLCTILDRFMDGTLSPDCMEFFVLMELIDRDIQCGRRSAELSRAKEASQEWSAQSDAAT